MWGINLEFLGEPTDLFESMVELIEGGRDGAFWKDIQVFYRIKTSNFVGVFLLCTNKE